MYTYTPDLSRMQTQLFLCIIALEIKLQNIKQPKQIFATKEIIAKNDSLGFLNVFAISHKIIQDFLEGI